MAFAGTLPAVTPSLYGVSQGSVLEPLLFLLHTAELFDIIASYAGNTQLYISAPTLSVTTTVQQFVSCVEKVDAWMSSNRLKMNADKTHLIWLGTRQQLAKLTVTEQSLLAAHVQFSTTVSDLVVLVDGQLSMADNVASLRRSCSFQLRQLRLVRSSLTDDSAKALDAFCWGSCRRCRTLLHVL